MKLGEFMKKRTRDMAIAGGVLSVGLIGAFAAYQQTKSEQKAGRITISNPISGTGVITSSTKEVVINSPQPVNQGTTYNPVPNYQSNDNVAMDSDVGPAGQNRFTNNPQPANIPQSQAQQVQNLPASQPVSASSGKAQCAPDALKVGIKHFKYADANPADLVASGYGSDPKFKIHKAAKPALQEMIAAARADGVTLTPGSILRTSSRQAQIVANKKKQGQSAKQIYYTSSHPGYSEHHTGLAVDFSPINHSFAKGKGYAWLKRNAHKYGFYQTFTPEYSRYSGVSEESWHWRFEGKNGEFASIFAASKNHAC